MEKNDENPVDQTPQFPGPNRTIPTPGAEGHPLNPEQ